MLDSSLASMLELWAPVTPFAGQKTQSAATTDNDSRALKLQRLKLGGRPRVLDLFAGCGGMSLGFSAAGFSLSGSVESDPLAAESHARNFYREKSWQERANHAVARDITSTSPQTLVHDLNLGVTSECVDVLIGGPPCQAFARVGRAKLREIAEHPQAFKNDGRANLYISFMEYVTALQPLAVVMENVPDVM
jgi:DNA (cytosine-5)-methyltransferase 1